ncbi:MAG: LURP-one-related family protein, partial [Solobacterium sp.]|nr:LURP-one-related family protein [Solobacterium sp.]
MYIEMIQPELIIMVIFVVGIFVIATTLQRYHSAGEKTDIRNYNDYGEPAKSLYTSRYLFSFHKDIDVTDDNDNLVYHSSSKIFSFTNETTITDAQDRVVASIEKKLFSLHSIHYIDVVGGKSFELSKDLFRLLDMKFTINELGWTLQGDFSNLNFVLYNNQERVIAVVGQKLFSMRDKYCIDLYDVNEEATVVAIVITLENMLMAIRSANDSTS